MRYHYILNVEHDGRRRSRHSVVTVPEDATRSATLAFLLAGMGLPQDVLITGFTLEPDDLGVTA